MFQKSLISLLMVSALSACGGGSSEDKKTTAPEVETPPAPPQAGMVQYRVIDGYIENSEVCIIRADQSNCEIVGSTDEHGIIEIADDITEGQLVATITGGESKDADAVGYVGHSYQMITDISSETPNVITPFTTIDVIDDNKTMADIAAELNLPASALADDYVGSDDSTNAHIHAIARSLVYELAKDVNDNNLERIYIAANDVNDYINTELSNNGVDLDEINVYYSGYGVTHSAKMASLEDYLESSPLNFASMNSAYFDDEGVQQAVFSNGTVTVNGSGLSYSVEGDTLKMGSGSEGDKYLYVSSELSLSVPLSAKDMIVMSPHEFERQSDDTWLYSELVVAPLYLIFDDAPSYDFNARPTLVKLEFISLSEVLLTEGNEVMTAYWNRNDDGSLFIQTDEFSVNYYKLFNDKNMFVVGEGDLGKPVNLIVKDENLAKSILAEWKSL